jgi:serine/threonine protein kinase
VNAADLLHREGPLSVGRAVRLLSEVLEALHYAHSQGFVHRDVKPANVLVTRGQNGATCKLADFGLARVYQASSMSGITMLGDTGGTLPYMPPEQITHYRDTSPAADQYSAAATLYRFLTGQHIFDVQGLSNADRLVKILFDPPVPIQDRRPDVPDALARAIHRALEKKPADRFPDAASFREALLPFVRRT